MMSKIRRIFDMLWYKLRFGNEIEFHGVPNFVRGSQLKTKNGKIIMGRHFSIKPGAYLAAVNGGCLSVGDSVSINRNTIIVCHEAITIGDRCIFGPNSLVYDHDHKFAAEGIQPGYKSAPIVIEAGCWIGAGVIILQGTHIGEGSVIGAGAIVKGNIPPHSKVTSDRRMNVQPIIDRKSSEE